MPGKELCEDPEGRACWECPRKSQEPDMAAVSRESRRGGDQKSNGTVESGALGDSKDWAFAERNGKALI